MAHRQLTSSSNTISSGGAAAVAPAGSGSDEAAGSVDFNVDMLEIDHLDHDPEDP